ncbi:2-polyprenyl-3-methyl-5-hydroxy-6-metoxy-1,4-benzoquinol methylase [Cytobacillus eiseniae]|uniref:2-polyprenyl-3-methyl-5-hydroxy-6-metoxy-1, 4-benzoquinol methylase n=1 Tax=Cytobacillus eiseniae TaxID=762947 RepID=A0ABS4RGV7_9BACI|nr:class I SAM-dependent methyltransferase [Cytobacillus eiseniae]MBP2242124.1 2-polyprenyl-3-methyl-5-hydroxy-6-metoxy-1,4-benzoquinol methylase [Cytobacillus eiseniae]
MRQNIYDNDQFFQQYVAIRDRENNYNNLLEQPNLLSLVPTLEGKVVLDIGCGMGDFAAYCVREGAKQVTGIDISSNMIQVAKERHLHDRLTFKNIAFEEFAVRNESIDFISSSLVFHYVADFQQLIEKISAALCARGTVLFSIEHPIVTANKGNADWIQDKDGRLLYYAMDHYQKEGIRKGNWLVNDVIMYHRTFSTIINTLIENGLQIEKVIEPTPTSEAVSKLPSLEKQFRCPSFLMIKAKKG